MVKDSLDVPPASLNGIVRTGSVKRRGKRRGPWAYATPEARSQRRKGKLREVRFCNLFVLFKILI